MKNTNTEFLEKYGDVEVVFSYYFKFVFYYTAFLGDGKVLTCGCGGSAEEICGLDVLAGVTVSVKELEPSRGFVKNEDNTYSDEFLSF